MKTRIAAAAAATLLLISPLQSALACSCQNNDPTAYVNQQLMDLAMRQPSEADRKLARGFRMRGMPIDAAEYYRKAAEKAADEFKNDPMVAKHSAELEREAAQFLQQKGDIIDAAKIWENALSTFEALTPVSPQIAADYGVIGSLYETGGRYSQAESAYEKQLQMLQATTGRYSRQYSLATEDYNRARRKAQQATVGAGLQ